MWNKRPEDELFKPYTPNLGGSAQTPLAPAPAESKKENIAPMPSNNTNPTLTPTPTSTPTPTAFSTSTSSPAVKTNQEPARGCATIGRAVKVVGEIYSNEDLFIEGYVQGTVEALDSKLTIGLNGTMQASIMAREVVVEGTVEGNVTAAERIEIRKDAKLVGDIRTARIVVEDGAFFKGSIDLSRPETAGGHKTQAGSSASSSSSNNHRAAAVESESEKLVGALG